MSNINVSDYLAALHNTSDFGKLLTTAKHLIEVQKHLLNILPSHLSDRCTVGRHTPEGLLVIYIDNGAVATRLRNFTLSIQQKMNAAGIKVSTIKFRIQPQLHTHESTNIRKTEHLLSQTAIDHLNKLSRSLSTESLLQSSLKSLLANSNQGPIR